jgi:hypothetical protein
MNPRLEIASRLLAGMLGKPWSPEYPCPSVSNAASLADALIKECGDECPTRSIASEHVNAMEFQLKAEIQARMRAEDGWKAETERYLHVQKKYIALVQGCQKLVEEWKGGVRYHVARELEAVLKGGAL